MSGGTSATLMAVSLAIAAASAVAQDQGQRAQAKSQADYQKAQQEAHNKAALQNAQAAIKEQNEQTAAERLQQMQNNEAASSEIQKNQRDFLQKRGMAVSSSPYGSGLSFDALMADFERSLAMNNNVVQEQLRMQGISADTNIRGYRDRAQSRIDSQQGYTPAPINQPNTLASALGFAGSAMNTFNTATNYGQHMPGKAPPAKTPTQPQVYPFKPIK